MATLEEHIAILRSSELYQKEQYNFSDFEESKLIGSISAQFF